MKNKKSIYIIVGISVFIGILHLIIGPNYQGICKDFVRGYLIDLLLPMNLFLLLQIALRKRTSVMISRIIGFSSTFLFGLTVEILQLNDIDFLGSTYDPWDILMYGIGALLGLLIDLLIIERFEKSIPAKL